MAVVEVGGKVVKTATSQFAVVSIFLGVKSSSLDHSKVSISYNNALYKALGMEVSKLYYGSSV